MEEGLGELLNEDGRGKEWVKKLLERRREKKRT